MNDKYLTVTQINRYIKYRLDNDENLRTVYLKGEISNFKNHTSGHFYFTLKDENSRILAVMFRREASKVNFVPKDGTHVLVIGRISLYEANGNYQIYIDEMIEDGVGNLYLEFEKLKKKLGDLGYFDESHKKPIPKFPKKVGVITASTGAAIRDIITTINRRYRLAEIILFPCLVQGEGAKDDIVRNLTLADSLGLDTIILGRGGGSIEDLWAFNEEIVADAIYKAKTPIISAVGHEIDFTISDFVSDLRAPTPTAAAELAVPNTVDLINRIKQDEVLLSRSINKKIDFAKARLQAVLDSYILKNPRSMYEVKMQKLDTLIDKLISKTSILIENRNHKYSMLLEKLSTNIKNTIDVKGYSFTSLIDKLEALSPIKTFKRGYSITKCDNKIIKSIKNIKKDMILNTTLEDGHIISKVMEVKDGN